MPWARASSLGRSLHCPASAVLPGPDGGEVLSWETQEAADWGTMVHHWKATGEILAMTPWARHHSFFEEVLSRTFTDPEAARRILWPPGGEHEVAVAVRCDGEKRPEHCVRFKRDGTTVEKEAWKAAFGPEWATGTMDYRLRVDGAVTIDDLKTGVGRYNPDTGARESTPPGSEQHGLYVLADWLVHGRSNTASRTTTTHWPRPRIPSTNRRRSLTALPPPTRLGHGWLYQDLDNFHNQLIMGYELTGIARLSPEAFAVVGDDCRFCPALVNCPSGRRFEAEQGRGPDAIQEEDVRP